MEHHPARSFAEVSLLEAVARRVPVDLVLKAIRPGSATRLHSKFLATREPDLLVLAVPEGPEGRKVFVPADWDVGVSFELGNLWIQARTRVSGQGRHRLPGGRQVEAMLLKRPDHVVSRAGRAEPRRMADASHPVAAEVWFTDEEHPAHGTPARHGRVVNWSQEGLGIRLPVAVDAATGTHALIRLTIAGAGESLIYRAVLRHQRHNENDTWHAGFGELTTVSPGESTALIERLVRDD